MGTKFDGVSLAVKQNGYATKIVNTYIAYDLDALPKTTFREVSPKNCVFGPTNNKK